MAGSFEFSNFCWWKYESHIQTLGRWECGIKTGVGNPIKVNFDTNASRLKEKHGNQCQHLSTAWHSRILTPQEAATRSQKKSRQRPLQRPWLPWSSKYLAIHNHKVQRFTRRKTSALLVLLLLMHQHDDIGVSLPNTPILLGDLQDQSAALGQGS